MKIGIDIRAAGGFKTGKGWYAFHVVKEILASERKSGGGREYILYTNKVTADFAVFHNATIKVVHAHPFLWHFAVIKDFLQRGGEIFFAPTSFIIPAFLPRKIKSIITVHDLVAFLHPRLHEPKAVILEHLFLRLALRKTSVVITPSENTKKDLMRLFKYPAEKITVTPLAPAIHNSQLTTNNLQQKYNLPKDFILTVGGLEPRKNIDTLIDALLSLSKLYKLQATSYSLVIIGGRGWKSAKLQKKINENKKNIIWITHCPPEDLIAFYKSAKIFVFPSIYEGFGLPPLEAMAAGCPVICSNASSLKEVCGDAAILINPAHPQELKNAIEKLWNDENLQNSLREKGLTQAKKFSWQKTAKKTADWFF
ncbi:glycosyltransferase family 4 protein [Candidatus Peregrinibacteria bacterium]|nr:glycosyltransferase family 4 protein [Candidatus Peregrinibacteria bacterium]